MSIDLFSAVQALRGNWQYMNDVERGEAVLRIRAAGVSLRTLAQMVGCSEGLIRHLEIVGRLPMVLKERIWAGEPTGKFVAWARAQRAR